jgi:hypothetical protein
MRRRLRKRSEMPPRNDRCPDEEGEACRPKPEATERKADEDVAADWRVSQLGELNGKKMADEGVCIID